MINKPRAIDSKGVLGMKTYIYAYFVGNARSSIEVVIEEECASYARARLTEKCTQVEELTGIHLMPHNFHLVNRPD